MKQGKTIPVRFAGYQTWRRGRFALYTLQIDMGTFPAGSLVSLNTMALNGFTPREIDGRRIKLSTQE